MLGDQNKTTNVSPWWIVIPVVIVLLLVAGLGIGGYFAYQAWQASDGRQAESSNGPSVNFPSSNTTRPGSVNTGPVTVGGGGGVDSRTPPSGPTGSGGEVDVPVLTPTDTGSGGGVENEPPPPNSTPRRLPTVVSGGVLNGKAISLPKPAYPPVARAARAHGAVAVQVTIDETGNVISATAVSGHPLLRAAATSSARGAKFTPTKLSGVPVKVTGTIIYNFVAP